MNINFVLSEIPSAIKSPTRHPLKRSRESYHSSRDSYSDYSSDVDYPTIYDRDERRPNISDGEEDTDGSESEGERNENYLQEYFNRKYMRVQSILNKAKSISAF